LDFNRGLTAHSLYNPDISDRIEETNQLPPMVRYSFQVEFPYLFNLIQFNLDDFNRGMSSATTIIIQMAGMGYILG
jgi:hypothetical protein